MTGEGASLSLDASVWDLDTKAASTIVTTGSTLISELTADAKTTVTGNGSVQTAKLNASGCELVMQPAEVQLASGVTATIAGKSAASSTSVSVSPSTLSIDINNKDNIAFSYEFLFNADKNDLTRVTVGGKNLRQGTDYNILSDKNGIRIYKTYLSTLSVGTYTAELSFEDGTKAAIGGGMPVDVVSAATPLAYLKTGDLEGLKQIASVGDMFLGKVGGSMGEVSALMLLIGGLYLIWRKVINWQTPVAYIATVAVLTVLFPKAGGAEYMLYSIFGGGLFLGAFFMATDYATSPVTKKGQLIYGIGCGLFTVFIRYFGSYNEGVCYSIMVMNCCTALIDKYTKPVRFGVVKSDKKEAAAK